MRLFLVFIFAFCTFINAQQNDFNHINFAKADSIAYLQQGASLKNLPFLTYRLTNNLDTDVEKFRAIYIWVSFNIENDYSSYLRTKKKRKKIKRDETAFLAWNKGYTPKMFLKLVSDKKTACTGYAYLIKEMASLAGLECKIINGFGRVLNANLNLNSVPNHSWNSIKLNNKWYLCDATWSAGTFVIKDNIPTFKKEYVNGYFLTNPEVFSKNHYPIDKKWLFTKEPVSFKAFLDAPLLYKGALQLSTFPVVPDRMSISIEKSKLFKIELVSEEKLSKNDLIFFILNTGNQREPVIPKIKETKNGYVLSHLFNNRGSYDLHLNINGKAIATYVVNVTK